MKKAKLTAKKVRLAIKSGMSPDEMAKKYGCTVEELKSQIYRLYKYDNGDGSKAQSIYRQLEANRKKVANRSKSAKATATFGVAKVDGVAEITGGPRSLEDLRATEKLLSDKVIALEVEHKELPTDHRACNSELRELQNQIEDIKNSLLDCKSRFDSVVTKADAIAQKMNDISTLRREQLTALERVRQEIEERANVTICVYSDGAIEALDSPDFVLDDEGYAELKAQITEREECLDLKVRDVNTLARLLKICENTEHLTLICDSSELEAAFWAIRRVR